MIKDKLKDPDKCKIFEPKKNQGVLLSIDTDGLVSAENISNKWQKEIVHAMKFEKSI